MGNVVGAILGFALLVSFVGGLAVSIGAIPFYVIAAIVLGMALIDIIQSFHAGEK